MDIEKNLDGATLVIALKGRLDTTSSPQFEAEIKSVPDGVSELIFDFSALEYVSSAGLRDILMAQKMMNARHGALKLKGVNEIVKKVLDLTGFSPLLTFI